MVKWNDNSVVQLTSNFVVTHLMQNFLRWKNCSQSRDKVKCPNIVMQYNKNMGLVDLTDMLSALYRITVETRRWCIKALWHLVKTAKLDGWILLDCHYAQISLPPKNILALLNFSTELSDTLKHANKPSASRVDVTWESGKFNCCIKERWDKSDCSYIMFKYKIWQPWSLLLVFGRQEAVSLMSGLL